MKSLVSIVCTTYNEEKLIEKTLNSFLSQKLDDMDLEILVVDGISSDKTREIIKSFEQKFSNLRLIDNPERKNPYGRNKGIQHAKGDYIALLGAHTIYAADYVKVCIEEMQRTGSIGASGKVVTSIDENTKEAQLCELILSNKFGVSGESFRTVKEGYTSMVNFPVYKKEVFEKIGLYDTNLIRNQDNDLNQRILDAGYKLYNTWKTGCRYYPEDKLLEIFSYAFRNGFWNAKSLIQKPKSMRLHHYIPFVFTMSLLITGALGFAETFTKWKLPCFLFLSIIGLHLITGFIFSLNIKKYRTAGNILILPFIFFIFHISYGLGTLKGFFFKEV